MSVVEITQSGLDEFRKLPEICPPLEFFGGRVVQKLSPKLPHNYLQPDLAASLNQYARPRRLGRAGTELRTVFGGVAVIFDVTFFVQARLPFLARKANPVEVTHPPDIAVEIHSPGQSLAELSARLRHAIRHGTRIGWLIHPVREYVMVFGPRRKMATLRSGDVLSGEDVLPGYTLPIDELFGWLDSD